MIENLFQIANEILKQADIVEVASHFIKVEKSGKNYIALCPFHDDKEYGNFYISKTKGIFKCFSCGAGGNAINFVQKITHCTYEEAVLKTAEIIGFDDERLKGAKIKKYVNPEEEEIRNCLKNISDFYSTSLFLSEDGKDALEYLHNRGLDDETIKYFKIGFSQTNGKNTIDFLKSKNFSLKTISETGILNLESTPYRDANSGRIAFSITDRNSNVIGFSCRKFRESDTSVAKYINTSSTKLFNKSTILYNFDNAINEANKVKYVYLLEGFMDVIACYRAGVKSAVAIMGTALTQENIQQLRYLKAEIRVCLDLDSPGQLNMYKIGKQLEESGLSYKFVNNDVDFTEKDADEILSKYGEEKLRSYLTNLVSYGEWLINYLRKNLDLSLLDGKRKFINSMIPYLSSIKEDIELEYYITTVSKITDLDKKVIINALKKYNRNNKKDNIVSTDYTETPTQVKKSKNQVISKLQLAEKELLHYMLNNKEVVDKFEVQLSYFITPEYKDIANLIADYILNVKEDDEYNVKSIISYLSNSDVKINNKEQITNDLIDLSLNSMKIPPYSDEIFKELVETIKNERQMISNLDFYKTSSKNMSEIEKSKYAKACLNKIKNQITELDKKRRN